MMPSLFISHGAPNRVLSNSSAKDFLKSLAKDLPEPKAIIVFSAHWLSHDLEISNNEELSTIHDFMGFSAELHKVQYEAKQPKWLFNKICALLQEKEIAYKKNSRGLDHGAWSVLSLSYPKGNIPITALSVPRYKNLNDYLLLGEAFKELRREGILIIGSGGATHNLSRLSHGSTPEPWAVDFVAWLQKCVQDKNYAELTNLYDAHPSATIAHPSLEHYVPLLIAAGAAMHEQSMLIHDSYEFGSLNNSCFSFGHHA